MTVPDSGCPNAGTWDPVGGRCVALKRKAKPVATYTIVTDKENGLGAGSKKEGNAAQKGIMTLFGTVAFGVVVSWFLP